ncbi:Sensors of blue-light using FAD [Poseidonocella pacifica]|uniref:Sensors of blue-light using FAD n=1 Tax=Poseidonocella pacifica TaxID=871651 RepID=A0A1I0VTZ5_9RHOB|nr:BLUF domain-containing protein [Poseidonocella pacifica]SFA79881.1 Sensors of blue-light using FAD [Poseidonocella pacifica]
MFYFSYHSRPCLRPGSLEEQDLIAQARIANGVCDITGFLYREGDLLLQYLEGPRAELIELRNRISVDSRHNAVVILGQGLTSRRFFTGWPLGFCTAAVGTFGRFLGDAWGKTSLTEATAQDARLFLDGMCQRFDLGLAS